MSTQAHCEHRDLFFGTWFGGSARRFPIMVLVVLGLSAGSRAFAAEPVAAAAPPAPDQLPTGGRSLPGKRRCNSGSMMTPRYSTSSRTVNAP